MMDGALRRANDMANRWESRRGQWRTLSFPEEIIIEPTNRCNSRCLMCVPYRRNPDLPRPPQGLLAWVTLERLRPVLRYVRKVLFCGFGEPLLHPEFVHMLRWIRMRAPYVYLYTNGTLIDEAMADDLVRVGTDHVSFSMGGATAATFERVRGVSFDSALDGVKRLAKARADAGSSAPRMSFNVVAMNSVLPELKALVDLAKEHGVASVMVPQLWVESPEVAGESVFVNPAAEAMLREARRHAERSGIEFQAWDYPPGPRRCVEPYRKVFIAFNGDVFPCAHERHVMGNVRTDSFRRIWHSKGYGNLRRLLRTSPEKVCPGCPEWMGTPESFMHPAKHFRGGEGCCGEGGVPGGDKEKVREERGGCGRNR